MFRLFFSVNYYTIIFIPIFPKNGIITCPGDPSHVTPPALSFGAVPPFFCTPSVRSSRSATKFTEVKVYMYHRCAAEYVKSLSECISNARFNWSTLFMSHREAFQAGQVNSLTSPQAFSECAYYFGVSVFEILIIVSSTQNRYTWIFSIAGSTSAGRLSCYYIYIF